LLILLSGRYGVEEDKGTAGVISATAEFSASVFSVMTGVRRFSVVEHLSNAKLDEAIEEAQKADETRLVWRLCFVKGLSKGKPSNRLEMVLASPSLRVVAGHARRIKIALR